MPYFFSVAQLDPFVEGRRGSNEQLVRVVHIRTKVIKQSGNVRHFASDRDVLKKRRGCDIAVF